MSARRIADIIAVVFLLSGSFWFFYGMPGHYEAPLWAVGYLAALYGERLRRRG